MCMLLQDDLHHGHPCMPKEGQETTQIHRTTPCTYENTEKTHSEKRTRQANILGTASNNHTKT